MKSVWSLEAAFIDRNSIPLQGAVLLLCLNYQRPWVVGSWAMKLLSSSRSCWASSIM